MKTLTQDDIKNYDISQLEEAIILLDTLYETGQDCIDPISNNLVPDITYDVMRSRLKELSPDSTIFSAPTASTQAPTQQIKHDPPMVSIEKANGEKRTDQLANFLSKAMTALSYTEEDQRSRSEDNALFAQSYKRDGVAVAIKWENGKLVSAGLRPRDGINGEDVTKNIVHVQGVLETLPLPITIEIRGELECRIETFNKMNADATKNGTDTYSNPRMFTAGTIRKWKDADTTRLNMINFTGYLVENYHDPNLATAISQAKWVNKILGVNFVQKRPFDGSSLPLMEINAPKLAYEVDGVVVEVNNLEDCEQYGRHGDNPVGNPRGKIAWKFNEREYPVVVDDIRWQTGRTGRVTPVLMFQGVMIDGTKVVQCTAHNVGIVQSLGLGTSAKITIIKSGKIIPKIASLVLGAKYAPVPDVCASCGEKLDYISDGKTTTIVGKEVIVADFVCPNKDGCPAQNIQSLKHYLDTMGCKGVGPSMIEKMVSANLVGYPSDFYALTLKDLQQAGVTERQGMLAIASIWKVRSPDKIKDNYKLEEKIEDAKQKGITVPLQHLIASLGIHGASKGTGRKLSDTFGTLEAVMAATVEELEKVDDVGTKTAESLHSYFEKHKDDIEALSEFVHVEVPKQGVFSGMKFVFTGSFPGGKSRWQSFVEENGGQIGSSVSKKTDVVVIGPDAGSKETKARDLNSKTGKPILLEGSDALEQFLAEKNE